MSQLKHNCDEKMNQQLSLMSDITETDEEKNSCLEVSHVKNVNVR